MKIKNYDSIKVNLVRSTNNPLNLILRACNVTMKKDYETKKKGPEKLFKYLIDSNHTSVFEHIYLTFEIKGASRSFLAQITRHRIASYTSASQHYQNYSNYPFVCSNKINKKDIQKLLNDIMEKYNYLISKGVPKYEARQILPNGMTNNLIITMNIRSLINLFNLRLCKRNTEEIMLVAEKMYAICNKKIPEIFKYIGPDCVMKGKCTQGKMSCLNQVSK